MYLSFMRLNPLSAAVQRDLRDVAGMHRTIMKAYPEIVDPEVSARAFFGVLYRLEFERVTGRILLYAQSRIRPDWSQLPDGYLYPEDGMPNPAIKAVDRVYADLKTGRVLRFRLRANPTRKVDTRSSSNGVKRNGRRVPVRGLEEQIGWLTRKSVECGFVLLQVAVSASGAAELVKSYGTGRTFQGVLFNGRLAVQDAKLFQDALAMGIGPGKAFGFGMLSIGPG